MKIVRPFRTAKEHVWLNVLGTVSHVHVAESFSIVDIAIYNGILIIKSIIFIYL